MKRNAQRRAWRRASARVVAILFATAALATARQAPAAVSDDRAALVQGLEAQFEVALIRERRLADDRETTLIATLEARLKAAHADVQSARGDARAASLALDAARRDYEALAARLGGRDPDAASEIADYAAKLQTVAAAASPAMVAALQRFADGDRTGAWPQIVALAAEANAAPGLTGSAKAAEITELAALRNIMRAHGEAATADVLDLYDQSAALDPSVFAVQIARCKLANDLGDLARARAAAEAALTVANTDGEQAVALRFIGNQAAKQADNAAALSAYDRSLALTRHVLLSDPGDGVRANLGWVLASRGDLELAVGNFAEARASETEALGLHQTLAAAHPTDTQLQGSIANELLSLGDIDEQSGDGQGALAAWRQGFAIRQTLLAADPTNTDLAFSATAFIRRMGELAYKAGDYKAALGFFQQCLTIHQHLLEANPSSAHILMAVGMDEFQLGSTDFQQNAQADSLAAYEQSLAVRRKLVATDPTNADYHEQLLRTLWRLARFPGSDVTWPAVLAEYQTVAKAGHLIAADTQVLQSLKDHGLNP
jgi:tetratricopeptide (TPR) repeat protein